MNDQLKNSNYSTTKARRHQGTQKTNLKNSLQGKNADVGGCDSFNSIKLSW